MRTLLLMLFCYTSFGQTTDPALVYSIHTRLGMNGSIKHVTTYKYTKLKYKKGKEAEATGTLYSVIKNWYDSSGRIIRDSTAMFYNRQSAFCYTKDYSYTVQDETPVILITTRFDCAPPHDNKAVEQSIVELTMPDDTTVLAREYKGHTLEKIRPQIESSYRFTWREGLIRRTVFEAYRKGQRQYGTTTYQYDQYNNFTQTNLAIGEAPGQTIKHKVLLIDDYGNALHMLNYKDKSPAPDFMTEYVFEYYE